jgi:hypothetical protein
LRVTSKLTAQRLYHFDMLEAAVLRVFRACLAFVLRPEDVMSCGVFVRVTSVSF